MTSRGISQKWSCWDPDYRHSVRNVDKHDRTGTNNHIGPYRDTRNYRGVRSDPGSRSDMYSAGNDCAGRDVHAIPEPYVMLYDSSAVHDDGITDGCSRVDHDLRHDHGSLADAG